MANVDNWQILTKVYDRQTPIATIVTTANIVLWQRICTSNKSPHQRARAAAIIHEQNHPSHEEMCKGGGKDDGLVSISLWQNHHLDRNPACLQGSSTYIHKYTHITLHAHVYMFGSRQTCVRADIYYGRCICVRAIYYRHMYTCEYIFLMLLRLTVHICIHAKIYIMAYHLLFDFTKPYSGRPPHRANIGQA